MSLLCFLTLFLAGPSVAEGGGARFPQRWVRCEPKPGRLAGQEARTVERRPLIASGD